MMASALFVAILTLVGLTFAQAVMHKLRNPQRFVQAVRDYDLLPGALARPASMFLMMAELSIVVLILTSLILASLLDSLIARSGLATTALLLALYGVAMGINLARQKPGLDCGCTSGTTPISMGLVLRNIVLSVIALAAAAIPGPASDGMTLGIPAGVALFLGYLTVTQLMSNRMQRGMPKEAQ